MVTINTIFQIGLLVLSGLTIYYLTHGHALKGAIAGLISEVFWFGVALTSEQWSILILTFWYSYCFVTLIQTELHQRKKGQI